MVSYALKRGCTDLILVYPNISETINESDRFEVFSGFDGGEKIKITALEIPFWSFSNFQGLDDRLVASVSLNLDGVLFNAF